MYSMMSLSFKILSSFQTEFKVMVEESADMELENFCALTNSNIKFIANMRQFLEATKDMSGQPVETLQKSFQLTFLMKGFAEICNGSYLRIQDLIKGRVSDAFMAIKDYKKVVIVVSNPNPARLHREPLHESEGDIREALPELFEKAVEVHT
jgi:hypothetical protein